MLNFDDYERYLLTHQTPYDQIGHHRLHLQLCINDQGRDHIIKHIPPELSHLWLDDLISAIEDLLMDREESRHLLDSGKFLYRSGYSLRVKIEISIIHVCVRVVSYPPIRNHVEDEMSEAHEREILEAEEFLSEQEEVARREIAEEDTFRNMFTNLPVLTTDDGDSGNG